MRKEIYGYSAVIVAAVLWGVGGTVAKSLFNQEINPFILVKVRLVLSFLILAACLFIYDRKLLVISRRDIIYFAILGTCGMALCQLTYFYAIALTGVATGVFLQYLSPILMACYEVIREKAVLGIQRGIAIFAATVGGLMVMLGSGGTGNINLLGIFIGLLSAIAFSFNTLYGRRAARHYHPLTGMTYSFGFGALFFWLISPEIPPPEILTNATFWGLAVYISVFSTILPFCLYFTGLRFLPPTNTGTIACLEPVIAALSAYIALGEIMSPLQILGGVFVIAAVIILQTSFGAEAFKKITKKNSGLQTKA